jgi:surface antigen
MTMTPAFRFAALASLPAVLLASVPASALDPNAAAPSAVARASATAEGDAPRRSGIGGIFGCSTDGNKQTTAAVIGGVVGGVLGNRIAGSGNRTLGTLLGGALGAAGGSALGCKLQKNDQAKAERAMQDALAKGENQSWDNPETGASGNVEVSSAVSGATLSGLKFAKGIEPWTGYRKVGGAFVSTSSANIRSRPGLDGQIVGKLPSGARVWVPAATEGAPWYLISDNGLANGYVSNAMLKRASTETASNCRMVRQTVAMANQGSESETFQACKDNAGQWVLTRV